MKRVKNLTVAVLFTVLSTGMVIAQDLSEVFEDDNGRENVRLEEFSYARYKLVYPVRNTEVVFVKIYNQNNQLVYSEKIKNKDGFTRPYDISKLPDGKYKFIMKSSNGSIMRDILHKFEKNDLNVSIVGTGTEDSYKLIVRGVSPNPVYVDIYTDKKGLVFEDTIDSGKNFSRVYTFQKKTDNLTFVVTQKNNSVTKHVR